MALAVNGYGMFYHDRLVLTGQINDVGAPVMVNVKKSHRIGVELQWGIEDAFQPSELGCQSYPERQQDSRVSLNMWMTGTAGAQQAFDLGTTRTLLFTGR
ncbi:MAG: hypothetical protein MZV63_13295 [Marinilabiliales bacterium]|nr:hypothetical protein [Marinilabiliales bacterium]